MPLPEGFSPPDWNAPLDVEARLAALPSNAQLKGWVLSSIVNAAKDRGVTLPGARRYIGFSDYPAQEYLELLVSAAKLIDPRFPPRRTLYEVGRAAYPTFAASILGRIVVSALLTPNEPSMEQLRAVSKVYRVTSNGASSAELTDWVPGEFAVLRFETYGASPTPITRACSPAPPRGSEIRTQSCS
jgi:hypothetical protein